MKMHDLMSKLNRLLSPVGERPGNQDLEDCRSTEESNAKQIVLDSDDSSRESDDGMPPLESSESPPYDFTPLDRHGQEENEQTNYNSLSIDMANFQVMTGGASFRMYRAQRQHQLKTISEKIQHNSDIELVLQAKAKAPRRRLLPQIKQTGGQFSSDISLTTSFDDDLTADDINCQLPAKYDGRRRKRKEKAVSFRIKKEEGKVKARISNLYISRGTTYKMEEENDIAYVQSSHHLGIGVNKTVQRGCGSQVFQSAYLNSQSPRVQQPKMLSPVGSAAQSRGIPTNAMGTFEEPLPSEVNFKRKFGRNRLIQSPAAFSISAVSILPKAGESNAGLVSAASSARGVTSSNELRVDDDQVCPKTKILAPINMAPYVTPQQTKAKAAQLLTEARTALTLEGKKVVKETANAQASCPVKNTTQKALADSTFQAMQSPRSSFSQFKRVVYKDGLANDQEEMGVSEPTIRSKAFFSLPVVESDPLKDRPIGSKKVMLDAPKTRPQQLTAIQSPRGKVADTETAHFLDQLVGAGRCSPAEGLKRVSPRKLQVAQQAIASLPAQKRRNMKLELLMEDDDTKFNNGYELYRTLDQGPSTTRPKQSFIPPFRSPNFGQRRQNISLLISQQNLKSMILNA